MTGSTTPDILPAPFGNPKMVSNNASSLKDQSIAQIASYANFDTIRQLKEPLNVAYLGPSVNQYPYIGYSAFYGNPTKDSSYSDYAAYSTQLFRLFDSSKSGIFTEPWSGGLDDQYKDSFWFGSPWNMTLGPTLRLGNLPTWHGYSLAGVGTIIYIYRGSTNTAIEDYVDISMDTTALPYQVFMNMGETANPAVAADGTNPSRYNFDMLTFVNGEYRNFGPGDTLRLVLPPLSANDLRSNEGDRAIGTRNLPALNINYVDTTVALNSRYYNRRAIAAGTPWRSAPLIW